MLYTHSKALSEIVPRGEALIECFTRNVHRLVLLAGFIQYLSN